MHAVTSMDKEQGEAVREAYRVALGLLVRREHSRYELERKLIKREHCLAVIGDALDRLTAEDALSEDRFTDAYVRMRKARGYGPLRIQVELRERGINDGLIAHYLAVYGDDWDQSVERVYHKRFTKQAEDAKERARQQRFLQYRGFTHEQIQRVLR